jgi:5-methylcytosine-specific restriction protein A
MGPGHVFGRWKIHAPNELRPLLTDIYDQTENILYEAKGTATRVAIRMAIGQLLDYSRHIDRRGVRLAILLPHRPSEDLVELASGLGIAVVAEQDRGGFESIEPR